MGEAGVKARRIFAAVPVKSLARAKSRLARELDQPDRRAVTLDMVRAVLAQLAASPDVVSFVVVSRDRDVLELSRRSGGEALRETGEGLNAALEQARAWSLSRTAESLLVLPGDIPLIQAADLADLIALGDVHEVVIAPANDLGTNALLLRPPDA
ncbi:MAG: 2-phospho-L-lactate guanylyltransferase, partial [Chloroflexota bacterium]|nr:2-phospho-L-lactate guanylyltransferase [Chloroflexota bacterium]